eukprot:TRINITY_DN1886_c0_g1_i4.p1 TRINITY_DN1886_c0_g1~~TRINITY_DN1886_c0_g1_i4.p1  ORF type:complete len:243 (-),score=1.05 TRINITY_DN1886_c0_g1_i4:4-732(-)
MFLLGLLLLIFPWASHLQTSICKTITNETECYSIPHCAWCTSHNSPPCYDTNTERCCGTSYQIVCDTTTSSCCYQSFLGNDYPKCCSSNTTTCCEGRSSSQCCQRGLNCCASGMHDYPTTCCPPTAKCCEGQSSSVCSFPGRSDCFCATDTPPLPGQYCCAATGWPQMPEFSHVCNADEGCCVNSVSYASCYKKEKQLCCQPLLSGYIMVCPNLGEGSCCAYNSSVYCNDPSVAPCNATHNK